jgi:hypothetical protein
MSGHVVKVPVGRQHRQIVTDAKLSQQGIDCSDLNTATATLVSQLRGVNVVAPVGHQQRQGGKPIHYSPAIPRSGKTLQKLLQHQAGREYCLTRFEGPNQPVNLGHRRGRIPPQRQRPYAGIDKQAQLRVRSAL